MKVRKNKPEGAKNMNSTPWERIERVVFLICLIVAALDLYYWRP